MNSVCLKLKEVMEKRADNAGGMRESPVTKIAELGQIGTKSSMKFYAEEINGERKSGGLMAVEEDDLPDDRTMMQMEVNSTKKGKTNGAIRNNGQAKKKGKISKKRKTQKRRSNNRMPMGKRKENVEKAIGKTTEKVINGGMAPIKRMGTRREAMLKRETTTTFEHSNRLKQFPSSNASVSDHRQPTRIPFDCFLRPFGNVIVRLPIFSLSDSETFALLKRMGKEQNLSLEEKSGSFLFTRGNGHRNGDLLALTHGPDHIRIDEFRAGNLITETLECWPRTIGTLPLFIQHLHRKLLKFFA